MLHRVLDAGERVGCSLRFFFVDELRESKSTDRLQEIEHELAEAWAAEAEWQLYVGPVRLRRTMSSRSWFLLLVVLCATSFASGAVLTLMGDTKELGVALVVGAVFATASFLGQVWTVQVQEERKLLMDLRGRERRERFQRILQERQQLIDRDRD